MKIVLMNEFSQASKNESTRNILAEVAAANGHQSVNVGMKDDDDYRLTYIHLGIMSAVLLNSKAADFVVTGCGTGQGALMSLNAYPGVVCGYCIDPTDAFLYLQINNGNALSIPFAKGYGWGAEINIRYIFEKAFGSPSGQGYPTERKESQNTNAQLLNSVKAAVAKPLLEGLREIDPEILKHALNGEAFKTYFFANSQDSEITAFVKSIVD